MEIINLILCQPLINFEIKRTLKLILHLTVNFSCQYHYWYMKDSVSKNITDILKRFSKCDLKNLRYIYLHKDMKFTS